MKSANSAGCPGKMDNRNHRGAILARALMRIAGIGLPVLALDAGVQTALQHVEAAHGWGHPDVALAIVAIVGGGALLLLYRLLVRLVEKRAAHELGLARAPGESLAGMIVGAVLFSLVVAWVSAGGEVRVGGFNGLGGIGLPLASSVIAGIGEELVFRGAVFRVVREKYGAGAALCVSALLFGGTHAGNPGATWFSIGAVALEAGILLGLVYMLTGRLWLAIGLHIGRNFTESGIFGAVVSGYSSHGILSIHAVPDQQLWTGGAFGLESSLPAMSVCLVASLLAALYLAKRPRSS
jgi:uncharacterized protein